MSIIQSPVVRVHEVSDEVIRGLLKGVGVEGFFIGLHNAFSHGDALSNAGYEFTDEQLSQFFEHFEGLCELAKEIEQGN
jgi:hypothetical protein